MKNLSFMSVLLFFCSILLLSPISDLYAGSDIEKKEVFVDLDGDGINDNAADDNGVEVKGFEPAGETGAESDQSFSSMNMFDSVIDHKAAMASLIPNSERFGKLRFSTRAISCCRGGLESSDGFGSGIGSGAVFGVVCEGGVCRPR